VKLLVYDGDCGLCHWAVGFLIKRLNKDRAQLRFVSSTSEAGDYLLRKLNFDPDNLDSLVLYEFGKVSLRSQAVAKSLKDCRHLWPLCGDLVNIFPGRDYFYNKVAQNRQKFMKKDACVFDVDFGRFSLSSLEELREFYPEL
jgi:predicted DCC family thiol-disulfide oxidoreductase YuxK